MPKNQPTTIEECNAELERTQKKIRQYRCVSLRDNSCKYRRSYGSCRNRGCICKSLYTAVRTLCNQYFVFQLDVHSMWHCGFCSLRSYSHEGAKEHRK